MKKRALISVYDKTGIVEFSKALVEMGWEIISTGGTAKELQKHNIVTIDISTITKFPECLDGRVKTLHPRIHAGLLAVRENPSHMATLQELDVETIDIVVNNLYPFRETLQKTNVKHEEIVENIDIGGPSMLRAAAKNYKYVAVVVDPADYVSIIEELKNHGQVTIESKEYLAAKVFQYTASYDALISEYFNNKFNINAPDRITFTYVKKQELRYGENPHQKAAFYSEFIHTSGTLSDAEQLHGKELSFNNLNDTNGALETLKEFEQPTVVAVKHANPCGIGSDDKIENACLKAYEADKVSIFGGIIAANEEVNEEMAKILDKIFIEVIIAPSYSQEALHLLKRKQNIRILKLTNIRKNDYTTFTMRSIMGGALLQERNNLLMKSPLNTVTKRKPTQKEMEDLIFAWRSVKHVKSNGIVLAKDLQTVGIGPGQVSRIWALENAIRQAGTSAFESVMASDAFFPFSDCVEAAHQAGITAIIQPGGSIRDQESIEAANKYNIAMVFTDIRHFKH